MTRPRVKRPLIGITTEMEAARWKDRVRETALSPASYSLAIERAGGVPVLLPPVSPRLPGSAARLTARLDGLVFAGGADVESRWYGEPPHDRADRPDRARDAFEFALIRAAIADRLPFLAICRGLQVLNVVTGGTLIQHLPEAVGHDRHAPDRARLSAHDVRISPDSRLGSLLGRDAKVPTAHHQAVARLGTGLTAIAWADDQVVEAVELAGHPFAIGVQWHPEEGEDLRIFEGLRSAAQGSQQLAGSMGQ